MGFGDLPGFVALAVVIWHIMRHRKATEGQLPPTDAATSGEPPAFQFEEEDADMPKIGTLPKAVQSRILIEAHMRKMEDVVSDMARELPAIHNEMGPLESV